MAPKTKGPDAELAQVHAKRVELAKQRHEVGRAVDEAQRLIEAAADRRRGVLVAEARGETPAETVDQVDAERRQAEAAAIHGREQSEALQTVEKECQDEVNAIVDANPVHFQRKAEQASEAAVERLRAALAETEAAVAAFRHAGAEHSIVRKSRLRRGLESGPEVGIHDLGGAMLELSKAVDRPWPGGSRQAYERFLDWDARPKVPGTPAEAQAAFEAIG